MVAGGGARDERNHRFQIQMTLRPEGGGRNPRRTSRAVSGAPAFRPSGPMVPLVPRFTTGYHLTALRDCATHTDSFNGCSPSSNLISMQRLFLVTLALAFLSLPTNAEFRVALLIGGDGKGFASVAAGLEKYGFQCETSGELSGKELGRKLDSFASRTPTSATALVYFTGPVKAADSGGITLGAVPIGELFGSLSTRGGSRMNIVLAKSRDTPELGPHLPEGCLFAYTDLGSLTLGSTSAADLLAIIRPVGRSLQSTLPPTATIGGPGSVAISPPDQFVPGRKAGDEWVNSRGMVFCWCPPGRFIAGSPPGTPGRSPDEEARVVTIADGFWISKYELTETQNIRSKSKNSISETKNDPLNMLHWDDGSRMVSITLTDEERKAGRLPAGWQYHLPSADQWEYAARAGTTTRFYFGDDIHLLPRHANFADKSYYDSKDIFSNYAHRTLNDGYVKLAPVGSFAPNPWGLHDVYGNVAEWCRDHAVRGGGWVSVAENCRSGYRDSFGSRDQQAFLGYRIVIQPNIPEAEKAPKEPNKNKKK